MIRGAEEGQLAPTRRRVRTARCVIAAPWGPVRAWWSRYENEAVLDRMQDRLAERPEVLAQRRMVVEHPFGSIKQWMNQGAFLMRGLENVRGRVQLDGARAYNLRRVLNLVGFKELIGGSGGLRVGCRLRFDGLGTPRQRL